MALRECPECKNMVSDTSESCPQCGYVIIKREVKSEFLNITSLCGLFISTVFALFKSWFCLFVPIFFLLLYQLEYTKYKRKESGKLYDLKPLIQSRNICGFVFFVQIIIIIVMKFIRG